MTSFVPVRLRRVYTGSVTGFLGSRWATDRALSCRGQPPGVEEQNEAAGRAMNAGQFTLFREPNSDWEVFVAALVAADRPLAMETDATFARDIASNRWLLGVRAADGSAECCAGLEVSWSRVAPGFRILRASRLGHGVPAESLPSLARALAQVARGARALRLHVELFDPVSSRREIFAAALKNAGFSLAPNPRSYRRTILVDLQRSDADLLASFHSKVRRDIRALGKGGLVSRPITEPVLAERMNALLAETMGRTGGQFDAMPWSEWISYVRRQPNRALLLGVFRPERSGPDALVAYILGRRHGDIVEYTTAASTRSPELKVPLLYAPTWEMMQWARNGGSTCFDFGGVSEGSLGSGDPRGGITDFKRYFSDNVVEIGTEMMIEPSRIGSFVASVGTAVRRIVARS